MAQAIPTTPSDGPWKEEASGKVPAKRPAPQPIFKNSQMDQSGQATQAPHETETEEVTPRPEKRAKGGAPPLRRTGEEFLIRP